MSQHTQVPLLKDNAYNYIEKLAFLEKHLGGKASFKLLEIKELSSCRQNYYQLANIIAEFVGVHTSFIITQGAKDKGGEINIDGRYSFIDINQSVCKSYDQTLAVFAHEIMHRYLADNHLHYNDEIDNEILTDIATVYTGLGKLSLNGNCIVEKKTVGDTTTTTTSKVGYLDLESFCFVYLLICKLRKIEWDTFTYGLNKNVINMLCKVNSSSLFSCVSKDMEDEEVASYLSGELFACKQKAELCFDTINNLEKLVKTLNEDRRNIQDAILQTGKGIELLNIVEYNPILRSLQKAYQINSIGERLFQHDDAIKELSNKTERIERLFFEPKKSGNKGLKHLLYKISKKPK